MSWAWKWTASPAIAISMDSADSPDSPAVQAARQGQGGRESGCKTLHTHERISSGFIDARSGHYCEISTRASAIPRSPATE